MIVLACSENVFDGYNVLSDEGADISTFLRGVRNVARKLRSTVSFLSGNNIWGVINGANVLMQKSLLLLASSTIPLPDADGVEVRVLVLARVTVYAPCIQ